MLDKNQVLESLVQKCLADNQLPVDSKLVQEVATIFRKAGKRIFTAAMQTQLQAMGIRTEPEPVSHETVVQSALSAVKITTLKNCANAFVAGLDPELTALRAPLRAYAVVAHFPNHRATSITNDPRRESCRECGFSARDQMYCSVNDLQTLLAAGIHGRVKEGYAAAKALEWFATIPPITPTNEQVSRFEQLLGIIAEAPANATCNSLTKELRVLGGDKYNRLYVIETLGYCGVLITQTGEPLLDKWVDRQTIKEHPSKFNEAESPACFWKREFGFHAGRFRELFPAVQLPKALEGPKAG